jgi:hypothetical protein
MRSWIRGVIRGLAGVPRPTDDPRVHASGVDSDRILLFGSGLTMGWGVLSHDLALPGSLARAVSSLTGRGSDVDVVAGGEFRVATAVRELATVNLGRYDAVVLTLGLNESVVLSPVSAWRQDLDALLAFVAESTPPHTPIFVVGIQRMTEITQYDRLVGSINAHHRRALNRVSAALAAHREDVTFIPFDPPPRAQPTRYRTTAEYRQDGRFLAERIAPALDAAADPAGGRRRPRNVPVDSLARRNALDGLWSLDSSTEQRFDRLTEFARRSFHTPAAKITIVEGDRFWTKSSHGEPPTEGPRSDSICFTAIDSEDSLVIADASRDPRFAEMPAVKGPPPVRFYAGHRIEAPNGVPIGVLCVQDSEARDITGFDRALLRDIALLVQKEVWLRAQDAGLQRRRAIRPNNSVERTFAPASSSG